jgi:7-dehydrocholesterol reductase
MLSVDGLGGIPARIYAIYPSPYDPEVWKILGAFSALQLFLMKAVPGKRFEATLSAKGHVPVYKANGMASYCISLAIYAALVSFGWDSGIVYDKLGEMISSLSLFALILCVGLYFKGLYYPSTPDCGTLGHGFLNDYFKGTELYPRIFGWDVKQFTNCRFGMTFWAIAPLCYAHWQMRETGVLSDSMAVCACLQIAYLFKFFLWEMGYMCTMDIQHDRAGYYLCWGCLVWVPALYTSSAMYLACHPVNLGASKALALLVAGIVCIWTNYDADRMRQHFRKMKGDCLIWGKPADYIEARYTTSAGGSNKSLLLCSGWWGVSRHFHYLPEILAATCWSLPASSSNILPYTYVIFLTILLTHRAFRDDARCGAKYGTYWEEYVAQVPFHVIPYIF